MSANQVLRVERGEVVGVSIVTIATLASIVGLDARVRLYPGGDPLRDAGQVRLLDRLRRRLPAGVSFRTEVPLPRVDDLRAWDGWVGGLAPHPATGRSSLPVEGETRFSDLQAFTRRLTQKLRDSGEPHVLVVVADTPGNRAGVHAARATIGELFPVSARRAMLALAEGRHPGGSALILL